MVLKAELKEEIMEMLAAYGRAYGKKDLPGIISFFSPGICGYGSGPDEETRDYATFRAHIARDLEQCDHVTVRFSNVLLNGEGSVAWMMAACTYDLIIQAKHQSLTGRMTGVLKKTHDRWLFELVHFSMPYAGQKTGESYPGHG